MASSPRKIASARANGALSHGPKTDAGKRAVALNGITHGLTAETVVLPNESDEEYQAEQRDYLDHFRPAEKPEIDLVHQLTAVQWRLVRYAGVESGLFEKRMDDQAAAITEKYSCINERTRLAIAFSALSDGTNSFALLNRYQARLHHEYQRILKSLQQMQAARLARDTKLQSKPSPDFEHSADPITVPVHAAFPEEQPDGIDEPKNQTTH